MGYLPFRPDLSPDFFDRTRKHFVTIRTKFAAALTLAMSDAIPPLCGR
jgi:hypothetical protein